MPRSADERGELLARALQGGAPAEGAGGDEQLNRELAVVSLLVAAGQRAQERLGPDDAARERMRQRILAGLAEPPAAGPPAAGPPAAGPPATGPPPAQVVPIAAVRRRRSAVAGVQGRLLVAAAAALCLLLALSGMSLVLARDALPGDALYGVKRSAESAELGLTFGDEPRGFKHLQFATARVDEIEALAARAGGTGADGDPARYLTALQAFDTDAAAGSRLLIDTATNDSGSELAALRGWAEQQGQRLGDARTAMPFSAGSRTASSLVLLSRVLQRVDALQARLACLAVTSGTRDDVGLLPADGPCVSATGTPGGPPPAPNVTSPAPTTQPQRGSQVFPGSPQRPGVPLGPLDPGGAGAGEPAPGTTAPAGQPPTTTQTDLTIPLPLPSISLPPLLPGLPTLSTG